MGGIAHQQTEKYRPRWWEVLLYVIGAGLVLLGGFVAAVRLDAEGDWSLRLSQLWDSIGLLSLGLAIVAIGLTLTILRVQQLEAAQGTRDTKNRQDQHDEVLRRIDEVLETTHSKVTETGQDVKRMLAAQVEAAKRASSSELEAVLPDDGEPDVLDELSLEGVRDGDISNLPLDTHALSDGRLLQEVETRDGVFYPVGAVPIGVLADIFEGWEAAYPQSKVRWNVGSLVGAYRSYSPSAMAEGRRTLRGAPWFVTFRRTDDSLVTFYVSRTGRKRAGQGEKKPVVKRLEGEGSEAQWVPLAQAPENP